MGMPKLAAEGPILGLPWRSAASRRTTRRAAAGRRRLIRLVVRLSRAGLGMAANGGFWIDCGGALHRAGKGRKAGFSRAPAASIMPWTTFGEVPERPIGPVSKGDTQSPNSPRKREKALENTGFSHFSAFCRNVPKWSEMRASGSKYYRSIPLSAPVPGAIPAPPTRPAGPAWGLARLCRPNAAQAIVGGLWAFLGRTVPPRRIAARSGRSTDRGHRQTARGRVRAGERIRS
jgi:hypothetical protein